MTDRGPTRSLSRAGQVAWFQFDVPAHHAQARTASASDRSSKERVSRGLWIFWEITVLNADGSLPQADAAITGGVHVPHGAGLAART